MNEVRVTAVLGAIDKRKIVEERKFYKSHHSSTNEESVPNYLYREEVTEHSQLQETQRKKKELKDHKKVPRSPLTDFNKAQVHHANKDLKQNPSDFFWGSLNY